MDWKSLLLSFDGRINRQPFWIGVAILIVLNVLASGIVGGVVGFIVGIALIYVWLAVGIKRCHDRGKSGWWIVISFIPLIGLIWAIIDLGILEGDADDNRFGPNPLADADGA